MQVEDENTFLLFFLLSLGTELLILKAFILFFVLCFLEGEFGTK